LKREPRRGAGQARTADVGAVVLGDDPACLLDLQLGFQLGRIVVLDVPAVVETLAGEGF